MISPEAYRVKSRENKCKKRGRPYVYSEELIIMLLFIKYALRLPYRQPEGLGRTLYSPLGIKVPNFRTLQYRFSKMGVELVGVSDWEDLPEEFVIVIDSTGMKVTSRGEWIRKRGGKKRMGWIKVHVALDVKSKRVIEVKVTDERVHDCQKAKELVEGAKEKVSRLGRRIKKVTADRGYDTLKFFEYLWKEGIEVAILVRKRARIRGNPLRDAVVRAVREDKDKWKEEVECGKRWLVESFFSAFKLWFGEYVSSVKFENIIREIVFKLSIMNLFLSVRAA